MTDDEFDKIAVGDELHATHTQYWSAIGVVKRRTAQQVTVRIDGQDHAIRRRSREWRLRAATEADRVLLDHKRRWRMVYWLRDQIPQYPMGGVDGWRWSPPDMPAAVVDLLLQAAVVLRAHQAASDPVGGDDGGGQK